MHNYYHQNMEVHLGIESGLSQYGNETNKSEPALIPNESSKCV